MTFPTVTSTGGSRNTATSPHVLNLPTPVAAGDLLIAALCVFGNWSFTWPAGWTVLHTGPTANNVASGSIAWKIAAGGETTVSVSTSGNGRMAYQTFRAAVGTHDPTTPPERSSVVLAAVASHNVPPLTPSWGADDTTWIAIGVMQRRGGITSYPASYTDGAHFWTDNSAAAALSAARRDINIATEDPGNFVYPASAQGFTCLVGIRPGGAPPPAAGRSFAVMVG